MGCSRPPDIVATGRAHDLNIWRRHPDVQHAYAADPAGLREGDLELRLWLAPPTGAAPGEPPARPSLGFRKADLELFGEGAVHPTFWDRFPGLDGLEIFEEMPDETYPNGWWVARIWLSPA